LPAGPVRLDGDRQAIGVNYLTRLAPLREADDRERRGVRRRDQLIGSGLDEERLGGDAECALDGQRRVREQTARVDASSTAGPASVVGDCQLPASQAPSSIALQSCSLPPNGTSTVPGVASGADGPRRRRTAPCEGALRARGRRGGRAADKHEVDVLLGRKPGEVRAR
jgi:hypothetical protein